MLHTFNIATIPIADKVNRHVNANYYAVQLEVLQDEVKRFGFFFAQAETAATISTELADRWAWAMEYRRYCCLNPNAPLGECETWTNDSMCVGNAQERLRAILAALATLGFRLQEGPNAFSLLAAAECCQGEWPPLFEGDLPDSEPHSSKGDKSNLDGDQRLSDEEHADALPIKRPNRTRLAATVTGGLLVVLAVSVYGISNQGEPKTVARALEEVQPKPTAAFLAPPPMMKAVAAFDGFCRRDAILCSTAITTSPAETMSNIVKTLPQGEAARYQVKVSVELIEE